MDEEACEQEVYRLSQLLTKRQEQIEQMRFALKTQYEDEATEAENNIKHTEELLCQKAGP